MEARPGPESAPVSWSEVLLAGAITLASLAVLLRNDPGGLTGDTDSYMHLARFRDPYGIFHGGFFLRDNAPYGTVIPWTMPFDGALALFYAIARPFTDSSGALYFAARAASPFFCITVGPLLFFGLRPFFSLRARTVMSGLAATSPNLITYGIPGEADYHTMMVWLSVLFAVLLIRHLFLDRARAWHAAAAGIAATGVCWSSVEALHILVTGLSAVVMYRCLVEKPPASRIWAYDLVFCAAFGLSLTAAWLVDSPYEGLLARAVDRLSIVYVSFAWLFAAALVGFDVYVSRVTTFSRARNLAVAALFGGTAFLAWVAIQPDILRGPMAQVDPALFGIWIDHVVEMQPLWLPRDWTTPHAVPLILVWAALAVLIARTGGLQRRLWIVCSLLMVPISLVGIRYVRAMYYPEVLGSIPLGLVLARWTRRLPMRIQYSAVMASSVAMLLTYICTVLLWDMFGQPGPKLATGLGACNQPSLAEAIAPIQDTESIVMTELDVAAMTLYLSPTLRTVAAGYLRNPKGILDDFAFYGARSDEDARAILDERGIQYVLICDRGAKRRADAFGDRILHDPPSWLAPVGSSVPRPGFRLYRVRRADG